MSNSDRNINILNPDANIYGDGLDVFNDSSNAINLNSNTQLHLPGLNDQNQLNSIIELENHRQIDIQEDEEDEDTYRHHYMTEKGFEGTMPKLKVLKNSNQHNSLSKKRLKSNSLNP